MIIKDPTWFMKTSLFDRNHQKKAVRGKQLLMSCPTNTLRMIHGVIISARRHLFISIFIYFLYI